MARERAVNAVDHEGECQPQRHGRPVLLERLVEREHRERRANGGEVMDGKRGEAGGHGPRDAPVASGFATVA